jgi:hypothetical protein
MWISIRAWRARKFGGIGLLFALYCRSLYLIECGGYPGMPMRVQSGLRLL